MKLILGTVQMGLNYGINNSTGKISVRKAIEILEYAYESGIRVLDTAEVYGNAHQVIGIYHKANPSCKFEIITKIPKNIFDHEIERRISEYLNELHINEIRLLMYHDFNNYIERHTKNSQVIEEIRKIGSIKKIGVSLYTNLQIETLLNELGPIDVIQMPYNLLDNLYQREAVLKKMRLAGIHIHTRSPFLQGIFFMPKDSSHVIYRALRPFLKELETIADDAGLSLYELALQYSYFNPLSDAVIMGVDSLDHLKLNLAAISKKMIESDIWTRIDTIAVSNPELLNPSLWK